MLCVRWYLSFKLSYRDLVAMMTERGIDLAHTTILRWVQTLHPGIPKALEPLRPNRWGFGNLNGQDIASSGRTLYCYFARTNPFRNGAHDREG